MIRRHAQQNTLFTKLVLGMAVVLLGSLSAVTFSFAQSNPMMNYQGKLTDGTGMAVIDGTYEIEFNLYTQAAGGMPVWTETLSGANEVLVTNGLFSVMLGSTTPLSNVDFDQTLYLGVTVEADAEMTPRKILGTVPAAFEAEHAGDSDTVGGVASSSFLRSDQADSASGLLTFTGGLISTASSTINNLTILTATTTNLVINGEQFTDLTGTGLQNNSGVLTLNTSYLNTLYASTTAFDTSAELLAILTDETGTGSVVFSDSPSFTGTMNLTGDAVFTSTGGGSYNFGDTLSFESSGGATLNLTDHINLQSASGSYLYIDEYISLDLANGAGAYFDAVAYVNSGYGDSLTMDGDVTITANDVIALTSTTTISERLGIGTSTPDELLVVSGSEYPKIKVTGSTSAAFSAKTSASLSKAFVLGAGTLGTTLNFDNSGYFSIQSDPKSDLDDLQGVTSLFVDGYDNQIGIGPTVNFSQARSPRANLEVAVLAGEAQRITADTGTSTYLSFYKNLTAQTYLGFGGPGDIFTSALQDSTSLRATNALHLGTNGDNIRLTITSAGKVGIDTTTPQGVLDVYSTTNGDPGDGEGIYLSSEEGGAAQIWRRGEGTLAMAPNIYVPTNFVNILNLGSDLVYEFQADGSAVFQSYQTPLIFRTAASAEPITFEIFNSEVMRLDANGLVGIGTSTPTSKLTVAGTSNFTGNLTLSGSAANIVLGNNFLSGDGDDEGIYVTSSGNVGVGTNSPTERLTIQGGNILQRAAGNPTLKGTFDSSDYALGVFVSGKYAYLADYSGGLQIIDVTDPLYPSLVGTYAGTEPYGVYVSGQYAYAFGDDRLTIIDVTDPSSPVFVGEYVTGAPVSAAYVQGRYAYVVSDLLYILDISDPTGPVLTGSYDSINSINGGTIDGKYVYLARAGGIDVVDVSDPTDPVAVFDGEGFLTAHYDVYVSGGYAYAVTGNAGLAIYDISDPTAIEHVGGYNTSGTAYSVQVAGDYAYVADTASGLQVIDISSSTNPTLAGTYNTPGAAYEVFVSGKYAYVADDESGLQIVDIYGAQLPALYAGVTETNVLNVAENIFIDGEAHAYAINTGLGGIHSLGGITSAAGASSFLGSLSIGTSTPSAALTVVGDVFISGTTTLAGNIAITGSIIPTADITYDLGSPDYQWRDVYIGPGSLYINGKKVIEDISNTITISTDNDQNLMTETTGIGNVTMRATGSGNAAVLSGSGNININSTSGNINLGTTGSGQLNLGTVDSGIWQGTAVADDYGGTGQTTYAAGDMLYASGVNTLAKRSIGSTGSVLSVVGGVPTWVATSTLGISSSVVAAGSSGELQFNAGGNFGAISTLRYATSSRELTIGDSSGATLHFGNSASISSGIDSLSFSAPGGFSADAGSEGFTFDTTATGNDGFNFNGSSDTPFNITGNSLNVSTVFGELVFDWQGNLGIGTSTPTSKLTVAGTSNFTGNLTLSGSAANIALGSNWLSGDGGDEGIFIDGGGNVGIGTTTIGGNTLAVDGIVQSSNGYIVGDGGASGAALSATILAISDFSMGQMLALTRGYDYGYGTTSSLLLSSGSFNIAIPDGSSPRFTITETGNVGIGTTTPSATLSVAGGLLVTGMSSLNETNFNNSALTGVDTLTIADIGQGEGLCFESGCDTGISVYTTAQGGYDALTFDADAGFDFVFNTGNVGIGTSTPSQKLTVAGNARITGALYDSTNSAGTSGYVLQSTGTGQQWVATSSLGFGSGSVAGTGATGRVAFWNDASSLSSDADFTFENSLLTAPILNVTGASTTVLSYNGTPLITASTTNNSFTAGPFAGANFTTTSQYNTAIGQYALYGANQGYNTALGYGAGYLSASTTNSDLLTAVGYFSGYGNSGDSVTAIGVQSGHQNRGTFGTFVGYGSGQGNTGSNPVFVGYGSGQQNTGNNSVGIGIQAAFQNTGTNVTVVGYQSGAQNTANALVAVGNEAFRYRNASSSVAIGYRAGYGSDAVRRSIANSTFIGFESGYGITTGNNNLLLGYRAGDALTSGSNNIAIGHDIDLPSNTSSNQLNIGNLLFGTGIDGTGTTLSTGNIGIGTSTPTSKLTVAGTSNFTGNLTLSGSAANIVLGSNFLSGDGGEEGVSVTGDGDIIFLGASGDELYLDLNEGSGYPTFYSSADVVSFASHTEILDGFELTLSDVGNDRSAYLFVEDNGSTVFGTSAGDLALLPAGNVGIGTSTPNAKLHIQASSGGADILLITSAAGEELVSIDDEGGFYNDSWACLAKCSFFADGGYVGIGTTTPHEIFDEELVITNEYSESSDTLIGIQNGSYRYKFGIEDDGNFTFQNLSESTRYLDITSSGNIGIGTTTPNSLLSMGKTTGLTGAVTAGIEQYFTFTNSTASAVYYGDNTYIHNNPTATSTLVGKMLRINDSTVLGNTVRGLEVQAHRGTNTQGENTALSGFARTFGVRGTTEGDAGGVFEPAGVFGETKGTTQGNAIRGYSGSITTSDLLSLFQDTSAFAGTGLLMNFGNSGGSFSSTTSKFVDFQTAGTSKFTVGAHGMTTIGDGTTSNNAGLQIGYGGLCVDNDGTCTASTTGRITSVSSAVGNSDLAEMYFGDDDLEPGDIIATAGILSIEKADTENAGNIIGVVSTKPGLTLGFDDSSLTSGQTGYPVALSGRVPIKLSTENGPIKKGDKIMLSSIPGVGMKAIGGGVVVGTALEDFDGEYAYSEGFVDQFGDDIAQSNTVPLNTETDERIHDGCSFGAGGALGEDDEECTPRDTDRFTNIESAVSDRAEEMKEALMALALEDAEVMQTADGETVYVGQALMFVNLGWHQSVQEQTVLAELTSTSTDLVLGSEDGEETLWDRLKTLAQGFVDGILSIAGLRAENVYVENELCVDGVCVTSDDLRALLREADRPEEGSGTGTPSQPEEEQIPSEEDDDTENGEEQLESHEGEEVEEDPEEPQEPIDEEELEQQGEAPPEEEVETEEGQETGGEEPEMHEEEEELEPQTEEPSI